MNELSLRHYYWSTSVQSPAVLVELYNGKQENAAVFGNSPAGNQYNYVNVTQYGAEKSHAGPAKATVQIKIQKVKR